MEKERILNLGQVEEEKPLGRDGEGKGWHTGELWYSVSWNKVGSWGTDRRDPKTSSKEGTLPGLWEHQQQTPLVSCRNLNLPHEYFNLQSANPESTQCNLIRSATPGRSQGITRTHSRNQSLLKTSY